MILKKLFKYADLVINTFITIIYDFKKNCFLETDAIQKSKN